MTLNGFGKWKIEKFFLCLINLFLLFIKGNGTVVDSHIPVDVIRRRKEQLKKEIQV